MEDDDRVTPAEAADFIVAAGFSMLWRLAKIWLLVVLVCIVVIAIAAPIGILLDAKEREQCKAHPYLLNDKKDMVICQNGTLVNMPNRPSNPD